MGSKAMGRGGGMWKKSTQHPHSAVPSPLTHTHKGDIQWYSVNLYVPPVSGQSLLFGGSICTPCCLLSLTLSTACEGRGGREGRREVGRREGGREEGGGRKGGRKKE